MISVDYLVSLYTKLQNGVPLDRFPSLHDEYAGKYKKLTQEQQGEIAELINKDNALYDL